MRLPSDVFSKSPETERLSGNTSIPSLADRLTVKPTRSSGRSDTPQRRSLVQKTRLELKYLPEPRSNRGFGHNLLISYEAAYLSEVTLILSQQHDWGRWQNDQS